MNLEAEIRDLAARRDIQKALFAYARGLDRLDPALQMTAFHADAHVDCGLMQGGPQAFVDFAQGFLAKMAGTQHLLGQIDLEVDAAAGTASGEVYFSAWHRTDENGVTADLFMAGRYIDSYRCVGGIWAIQSRHEIIDWVRNVPASDEILAQMPSLNRGRNGANRIGG